MASPRPGMNPYSRPVSAEDGSAPNPTGNFIWAGTSAYAVRDIPESTDPEYTTSFSPTLVAGGSPDGARLPDDIRTGQRKPEVTNPNDRMQNARDTADYHNRVADEETDVDWHVQQRAIPRPNVPLWNQDRPPTRPTADLAPAGYKFTRPWHIPRNIKDALGEDAVAHFSLADHRRNFEIFGMKPQGGVGTNTYRAPIRPWDESLYIPPQPEPPNVTNTSFVGNRNYRLG